MRIALALAFALVATAARGAEDAPQASGLLDGKRITFPAKGVPDGVKAAVGLLESCCDESAYQADEFEKAQKGDHVRLVFAKPVAVAVLGEKVEVSELVFRRPLNTGVFWVRTGDKWRRYTKYEFKKEAPFTAWLAEAHVAN